MISRRSLLVLPLGLLGAASGSLAKTSQVPLCVWITYSRGTDLQHGFRRVAMVSFPTDKDKLVLSRADIWPNETDDQPMVLTHISFVKTGQFLPVAKYSLGHTPMRVGETLTLISEETPTYWLSYWPKQANGKTFYENLRGRDDHTHTRQWRIAKVVETTEYLDVPTA